MEFGQLLVFLPAALVVAAAPGANNMIAVVNGAEAGWRGAVLGLAGRYGIFAGLALLAAGGLDSLISAVPRAMTAIKLAGIGYLIYLGLRFCRHPMIGTGDKARPSASSPIAREVAMSLTNPKAVLLFTAFVPQFVDPAAAVAVQIVALSATYIAIEFVAASGYAWVGSMVGSLPLSRRATGWINRAVGGVLLAGAAWLAHAEISAV